MGYSCLKVTFISGYLFWHILASSKFKLVFFLFEMQPYLTNPLNGVGMGLLSHDIGIEPSPSFFDTKLAY